MGKCGPYHDRHLNGRFHPVGPLAKGDLEVEPWRRRNEASVRHAGTGWADHDLVRVNLDTWEVADRLYLARGDDVSAYRPLFTGDILESVAIPGVQEDGLALIAAHPCSMRGKNAELNDRILMASVAPHKPVPPQKWVNGYLDRMPLPELRDPGSFEVAWLDRIGRATRDDLLRSARIGCLSPIGVNILQQRLVCCLTRVELPTSKFWESFSHTYVEADMLEDWIEALVARGASTAARERFESEVQPGC